MKNLWALVLLLPLAACQGPDKAFVSGVDSAWRVIGPEYVKYLEADQGITAETKVTRKRTAVLLTRLIDEAKKP